MIDESTRISHIINHNEAAIEIIAGINSNFRKLKNPVLRKLLAPRVNIRQAAQIGQVEPAVLLKALSTIGFQINNNKKILVPTHPRNKQKTDMEITHKIPFDVRPILESGVDPYKSIMEKIELLQPTEALVIINSFEPIPLLNILKSKGFLYETTRPAPGEVHTLLYRSNLLNVTESSQATKTTDSFDEIRHRFSDNMTEVDVRDLEMPMPMVTILEKLEQLGSNEALFVHHKKLPQYLIPELQNRGYSYVSQEAGFNNLKLIIYKP